MNKLTILTATYNRAHLLPDLYQSLCRQTCKGFVWVVVDDGSTDGTKELVSSWIDEEKFAIKYFYQTNGGKDRAINLGVLHISTPYAMIMDSDDYLTDDAIEFMLTKLEDVEGQEEYAGISGFRGISETESLNRMKGDYVDANNLERKALGIDRDCCEVYRTDLLKSHPFVVWEGEKFTPEEVVWNQLALEGYKLRWFNKVTCIVRYQEEGLTKDSWNLYRKNPMGYAMMFNHRLLYSGSFREKANNVIQMICCMFLGHGLIYCAKSNEKALTALLFPVGFLLSLRRRLQFTRK